MNVTNKQPSGVFTAICLSGVGLSVFLFVIFAFMPRHWETTRATPRPDGHHVDAITVLQPWFTNLFNLIWLGCLTGLLALGVTCAIRRFLVLAVAAFAAALLGPFACVVSFAHDPAPWQIHNELKASDGATFCFAESSFLQGQRMVLGRLSTYTNFTRTFEALVVTNGDNPRSYLRIVRPAGATDEYGQLILTQDNWLLGMRSENRCFFAYDLGGSRAYGHGDVETLSPFMPLDKDAAPDEDDVALLKQAWIAGELGSPTPAAVRGGLDHPNSRVRTIASELLNIQRK